MKIDKYINDLTELLEIPTISAQEKHKSDIQKACKWLKNKFEKLDFTAKILPTGGHPVVYAELIKDKNKPTILIYGHYDVQSPDPLNEWSSNPFKPEVRSNNIYGRGTADDKGQLYTWIAAINELKEKNISLPNIKFLIEGEEEIGSKNIDSFINDNKSLLEADICVISDSHCIDKDTPVICYGLRGLLYTEVEVITLPKDVHSGMYGGNVLNPINVLSHMIAKLKDEKGSILIPGFYDKVRNLTKKERSDLSKYPFTEKEVKEESGAQIVVGEKDFSVQERGGARPTLDVNGIWGGYIEEGVKTIIPGRATAKISMRLVPHQTCSEIAEKFQNYIKKITPLGAKAKVTVLSEGEGILMNKEGHFFDVAEKAYKKIFGKAPIYELSGGSIPITATLKSILNMDSILMGYGLPDDGLHSPNEKFSLEMFEKGINVNIEFLQNISK